MSKDDVLAPSIKTDRELNNVNSIEVVDKDDIDKDAAKNSEFRFAMKMKLRKMIFHNLHKVL